ncbi:ead/Ea22-like family protein [Citrobacter freundii]|nr:ead/Ea22-like family protein [Citrobacter freundii]MEB2764177.1 ead/Ea22-like family protein [Citrobacter freundii]
MTALNKQELREAAEKALNARERLELIESIFDGDGDITTEAQEDIKICTSFNDLTNPNTVLALLDELESAEKRIAELKIARDKCFLSGLKTGWEYGIADDTEGYNREIADAQAVIDRAAGIGVKGE